ncbi:MAG: hypothetical protein ACPGYT_05200, partial [Nitrospirales bacterium]
MKLIIVLSFFLGNMVLIDFGATVTFAESIQEVARGEPCPHDLSGLHEEMEHVLKSVRSEAFKKTMRASLVASIPNAIQQSDGITRQLRFIKR